MTNDMFKKSSHTCYLRIPSLPKKSSKGHIVPGLSYSPLVSINKYAEEVAKLFSIKNDELWYKGRKVLTGKAIGPGGLWILPIGGQQDLEKKIATKQEQTPPSIMASTVYRLPYKQYKIKYMHQTFF